MIDELEKMCVDKIQKWKVAGLVKEIADLAQNNNDEREGVNSSLFYLTLINSGLK